MATIREYFDTDARVLTWHGSWSVPTSTGAGFAEIIAKVAYDFEGNSKYWYIYIPATVDLPRCLEALYALSELRDCRLTGDSDAVQVQTGQMGYSELQSSQTLVFTKRIQLYLDFTLNENSRALLVKDALERAPKMKNLSLSYLMTLETRICSLENWLMNYQKTFVRFGTMNFL